MNRVKSGKRRAEELMRDGRGKAQTAERKEAKKGATAKHTAIHSAGYGLEA